MKPTFKRSGSALAVHALGLTLALAATPVLAQQSQTPSQAASQAELAQKLEQLAAELAEVKAQLAQLKAQPPQATAVAPGGWNGPAGSAPAAAAAAGATPVAALAPQGPATVLTGYGEINYNRPTKSTDKTQLDLRRFVLGLQHRINDRTKIVGELEVEHAVTSASDPGEVAMEQAYIEHQLTPTLAARGGLFLMPVGLLNETHEPTAFYGVERNFVETAIIPTTWREAGAQVIANFDNGLTLQGGISTSFDLTKWDAASGEGAESPLGSTHQEAAKAKARNLAWFGAANWRGVPGLLVGASLFSGNATHGQAGFANARVTLADVHARWTPGRWDLSALYARGSISNTDSLNLALVGNPTLIPKSFDGWYVQGAYKLWQQGDYTFSPFARLERFNTARAFADLGPGLTPDVARTEQVATVGANFWVTRSVVLKADYQRFRVNTQANRVNLGLGWSF
ncbi:porin [Acidovorax soli]|uniref:Phosphate-selective porin O and P n=1 Tax=Acidovorax soli TaxID=592050 RepID=A0A1H4AUI0_9BURK|nr:porin [Acidovorax soli]SEA39540.1 Phosphate-selective porin O and P [Acidovorax soli]